LKVLVVPAVNVEEAAGTVSAPFKLRVPAPPDIVITFDAAAEAVNVIPPLAFSVPVVRTTVPTGLPVALDPANVISPETVADPPLMFQAFVVLVVG
jgi:hypothetical protein